MSTVSERTTDSTPSAAVARPGTRARSRRRHASDLLLALAAVVAGALFFSSLHRLWPLADADLTVPRAELEARGRAALDRWSEPVTSFAHSSRLTVDDRTLDYIERTFGRDAAQALVRGGAPLAAYEVWFKHRGDPDARVAILHPNGTLLGWSRGVQDDAAGARLDVGTARAVARDALARGLGIAVAGGDTAAPPGDMARRWRAATWRETGAAERARPRRLDHTFTFERVLAGGPELRERAVVVVSGDRVTSARRGLVVPAAGDRAARGREAPVRALQTIGFALLVAGVVGAFTVFLLRLRDGSVRLGRAAFWSAVVFSCAFLTNALADASLFAAWDPLWPRWIATLTRLGDASAGTVWTMVVLLALIAAGDALDRESGSGRGDALWALGRGRLGDPRVGLASARGFGVGLVCGGVMAATVLLLERGAGAFTAVQPRGFFFYGLNSAAPSLSTLLFFVNIALLEELGYRFFAGAWLFRATRRRWLAVLLPAAVYGLTHTGLDFLPPAEPFWGRAVVMTLVGCVWGVAFLRWDALTVVVSHLTSDLFIFNWPRLASSHPDVRLAALLTVSAPLIPALVAGAVALARRGRADGASPPALAER